MVALVLSGCHKKHARVAAPPVVRPAAVEIGMASWYGHPYHGRPSASGEIYDMEKMTAAHRTLPFGTWVRVSDLDTGRSVDVRINDRGPFVDGRIIDISHAAAKTIGMIGPGTAKVRIEIIQPPAEMAPSLFAVQVGAFRDRASAERIRREMERRYGSARMVLRQGSPSVWRVLVGREATEDGAGALAGRIRDEGHEKHAFVVRLDG